MITLSIQQRLCVKLRCILSRDIPCTYAMHFPRPMQDDSHPIRHLCTGNLDGLLRVKDEVEPRVHDEVYVVQLY